MAKFPIRKKTIKPVSSSSRARAVKNILWLISDHLMTFIGGLVISIWLVRYLGPANLGIYGYALALFSITNSISSLGMGGVAIKELVETKDINSSIITIFFIKAIGSILAFVILVTYLFLGEPNPEKLWMSIIIGSAILLNPFSIFSDYFDSIVLSKYNVIAQKTGYLIKSTLMLAFIYQKWPFYWLAVIFIIEHLISYLLIICFFIKKKTGFIFALDLKKARYLLSQSWPLLISSLGAVLYLQMDQIMIVSMIDDTAGGFYNVAVRYTGTFFFLHAVIITSFFPSLIKSVGLCQKQYRNNILQLSSLLLYLSLFVILFTLLFADEAILFAFGEDYKPSIEIIKIHIWALPLVFWGAVLSKWLIIAELTKFSLVRHGMGLVVNFVLNLQLIPKYGGVGAAYASIFALIFSVLIILLIDSRLRTLLMIFITSAIYPITFFLKKSLK